jgi:hypothetical protein
MDATRSADAAARSATKLEGGAETASGRFPEVLARTPELGVATGENPGAPTAPGNPAGEGGWLTLGAASQQPGMAVDVSLPGQAILAAQLANARRGPELPPTTSARRGREDALDPATRQSAQLAPPFLSSCAAGVPAAPDAPVQIRASASLEEMLPAIVRRIAWSGDGKKGSLRLEFGAGALAGGSLVVHADGGRVRVELHAPKGSDVSAWKERIASRLESKRVHVDEITVE